MKKRYLVIGATGTVGSEIVKRLTQQGKSVRATTSKAIPKSEVPNLEWVQINLASGEGIQRAFEGIDRAFLISPPGYADMYKVLSPLIREAKHKNLEKIVLMTAMGANAVETSPFRRAEVELEQSGLKYNIIRPNWFMQNFNTFWVSGILSQSMIQLPAGTAKTSFIDARDIAEVATHLLTHDHQNNCAFDLTGPESLDHEEVAQVLSKVRGKRVQYQNIEPTLLKSGLVSAGLPTDYADFLVMIFGALREGYSARLTDSVESILGRKATTFEKYSQDYKSSWQISHRV